MELRGYIIEKYNHMGWAYTCRRLAEEAARRDISLRLVGAEDTLVTSEGLINEGELLKPCDFVLNRYKWGKRRDRLNALAARSYNALPAFARYVNKYEQRLRLSSEAFLQPRFVLCGSQVDFRKLTAQLGLPFVAKGLESSMGREVFLIERAADFEALCARFGPEKEWLLEELIRESLGRDMRLYSVRGRVIAAMERRNPNDFRANVALGAKVSPLTVTPQLRQAAADIYAQSGLDFVGIDLLYGKDKPYLCEINVMPGLEGMERATGVNVAGAVMETIRSDFDDADRFGLSACPPESSACLPGQAEDWAVELPSYMAEPVTDMAVAERLIYGSYLRAEKHQRYEDRDAKKRSPELLRPLFLEKAGTPAAVITGSKGKGSAATMLAALLCPERRVGLMTSPHLADFCERFRVDGVQIPEAELLSGLEALRPGLAALERGLPRDKCISPIGIQAALALAYFAEKQTDFNIFECGKGAQYDDVNRIPHRYAVINRIFAEHRRELGPTERAIAYDKAHVMDGEQRCAFSAAQTPEVMTVLRARAEAVGVPLRVYGEDFSAENICATRRGLCFDVRVGEACYPSLSLPLLGDFQAENAALALACAREIMGELSAETARRCLAQAHWPGRMEIVSEEPFVLLDSCVHPASCRLLPDILRRLGVTEVVLVLGIPDDKDYGGIVQVLQPFLSACILTRCRNPHYRFSEARRQRLERQLAGESIALWEYEDVAEALDRALTLGRPLVVLGINAVVAEARACFSV